MSRLQRRPGTPAGPYPGLDSLRPPAWRDGLAVAVALWPFLMLVSALVTELLTA